MVKIGDIELPDFPLLLAPMEDVSDPPFRALCKENGADVVYTEFISSEGLIRNAVKSTMKLDIYEKERPVGIQIFGANLDSMLKSVEIVEKSRFKLSSFFKPKLVALIIMSKFEISPHFIISILLNNFLKFSAFAFVLLQSVILEIFILIMSKII